MNNAADVTCIGELIVDLVSMEPGKSLTEACSFAKTAGGSPANLAVGLARLGVSSAFVGRVGDDPFGKFLYKELDKAGVQINGIIFDKDRKTRLAFVSLTETGDRDFEFWEANPADIHLIPTDIDMARVQKSKIVHISSFLMLNEPSRSTVSQILSQLKSTDCLISFDPNIRLSLWKSKSLAKKLLLKAVKFVDILRLNRNEAQFITGESDIEIAAGKLLSLGPSIVVVTQGEKSCFYLTQTVNGYVDAVSVKAVDTTGCGDGFNAGLLRGIIYSSMEISKLSDDHLRQTIKFAHAIGGMVATKQGAISALPLLEEVEEFMSKT